MIINLTIFQRSNLLEFLKRSTLKGEEVPAYVEVINAIQNAKEEETDPEKVKEETIKK